MSSTGGSFWKPMTKTLEPLKEVDGILVFFVNKNGASGVEIGYIFEDNVVSSVTQQAIDIRQIKYYGVIPYADK